MIIKEIDSKTFMEFANNHILSNYYQTENYGVLMQNFKYQIMYIGAYKYNKLVGASLILYKTIAPTIKYGYAPRGFLINYLDEDLLNEFTSKIKAFFLLKNFAFIKINPEVIYSKIDYENKKKIVNVNNKNLISLMRKFGYEKLKNNLYFESMLPKYNAIINLKEFDKNTVSEKCYKKSHSFLTSSLSLKIGNEKDINIFYDLIKDKSNKTKSYYGDFYKVFKDSDMVDLLLVEVDYYKYLEVYNKKYETMIIENEELNEEFNNNSQDEILFQNKMNSDNKLAEIKHSIDLLNTKLKSGNKSEIIGGALMIKQNSRVNLIISGVNSEFNKQNINYFLHYRFIEYYKKMGYSFIDLNAVSGNVSEKSPYKKLNDFKFSFNPNVYEYIGEFDLVINNTYYNILWNTGKLEKEFKN